MAATAKKAKAKKATIVSVKASELRGQKADQLKEQLAVLRKEAFNLRFQSATGELQNTNRKRQVRRDIARIHTVLREQGVTAGAVAPKTGAKKTAKKAASSKPKATKAKASTKKAKA